MKYPIISSNKVALLYFGLPRFTYFENLMNSHFEKISKSHTLPRVDIKCFGAMWEVKAVRELASPWALFHSNPIGENYQQDFRRHWKDAEINWLKSSVVPTPELSMLLRQTLTNRFPESTTQTSVAAVDVLLSHMYSLRVGAEMIKKYSKETGAKFDFVITIRTDLKIKKKIVVNRLDKNCVHVSKQHDRFPDNLIMYPFALIDAINCFDNILELANKVTYPVAESFKLAKLAEIDPQLKIKSHNWSLEIFRGEVTPKIC